MQIIKFKRDKKYIVWAKKVYAGGQCGNGMIVENGKLISVLQHRQEAANGFELIDLHNLYIFPGLKDYHIHLGLTSPEMRQQILNSCLNGGILYLRDGGDKHGLLFSLNLPEFPRIEISGRALYNPGGYGEYLGIPVDPENPEKSIADMANNGADIIKILLTGLNSFVVYGRIGKTQFTKHRFSNLVKYAGNYNLPVMTHVNGAQAITDAIEAGTATIEHGYFINKQAIKLLKQNQTIWTPTLVPLYRQLQMGNSGNKCVITATLNRHLHYISLALDAGVIPRPGTDAAGWDNYCSWYAKELQLFKQAGIRGNNLLISASNNYQGLRPGNKIVAQGADYDPLKNIDKLSPETILLAE